MSLSTGTVVFEDATLKAVELVAETMTLNNFSVSTATSLQQVTNTGNVTTNTVKFTNPTTAFVTTGNVEVGEGLTVSGNVEVGTSNLFVDTETGRVGIGTANPEEKLDVWGNTYVENNSIFMSGYNEGPSNNTEYSQYVGKRYDGRILAGMEIENVRTNSAGTAITPTGEYGQKLHFRAHDHALYGGLVSDRTMTLVGGKVGIRTTSPTAELDVNGYSKNGNPAFYARRNSVQNTGVYIFNVEELDTHNAYDTSNGRFTAPVAGRYVFNFFAITNGATACWVEFRKNGSRVYNATPLSDNVGSYATLAGTIVVELALNDYIDINVANGSAYGGGNDHNGFCGYMIG